MKKIKSFFSTMFGKNKSISQKPLTKLSIFFVIIFDIFLFNNLYEGYVYQWNLIQKPSELYNCEYIFDNNNNVSTNTIQEFYNFWKYTQTNNAVEICKNAKTLFTTQKQNIIENYKNSIQTIQDNINNTNSDIRSYEYQYGQYLKEANSGIQNQNDRLSQIEWWNAREKYLQLQNDLETYEEQKSQIISEFSRNSQLKSIFDFIKNNKKEFLDNYQDTYFWYPVKVALFQAILLIPIFLISLALYKIFVRKENKIFSILFSNLTFISGIFVLILLFKFLYFILPVKFFWDFIDMLKNLNLGFLWNYILVFLWIILFWAIIFFSQKGSDKLKKIKEENEKRKIEENKQIISKQRYFSNLCFDCGKTLLKDSNYCQNCWADQHFECNNCHHKVPKAFDFCNKCGTKK